MKPWYSRWGATDEEVNRSLPGKEYVPHPKGGYTQATTIQASVAEVWPWVAQIGQGRGGLYSYDALENLVGCKIHSSDHIVPELQHWADGEGLRLYPDAPPIPLAVFEPDMTLLFAGRDEKEIGNSWGFYLEKIDESTTRLIARWHFDYKPKLGNKILFNGIVEPISGVMQRKMLLGIKRRAEAVKKAAAI
ncbi:hypothetical protein ACFLX3_03030 [Chloroflexota bacterium]